MSSSRNLYKLDSMADNPAYEGFDSAEDQGPAALRFDKMRRAEDRQYKPQRLLPNWRPPKVTGRVRKTNDFPAIGLVPAFSERAADALRDLLEPAGELLPLDSKLGKYFAYNPLVVADVLDHQRSQITWLKKPIYASGIDRYEVIPEKLEGLTIFWLPYSPNDLFVTDAFVERVRKHDLKGMSFVKVWPLPPGVRWQEVRKDQWREEEREGLAAGKTVKGNTVVIRLPLRDANAARPTPEEEATIARLEAELDGLLVDPGATGPLVGSREGRDEVKGEARIFLTCPDADALVQHLRLWLKRLRWPAAFRVLKRYGEFVDPDAREQYVDPL